MKLTDILKQSGIELGKVYTDKTLMPFKIDSELNEASDKIQVQGIGVYSYDVLKQRVQKQTLDLAKQAKKGDWKRISKSGIEALASMWEALITYEEKK